MSIDSYDRAILRRLQRDGRISNQDLAEAVSLSPSPCLRRVKRLEEEGIIESYSARLNARSLGFRLMAFIHISMDRHTPDRFDYFETAVEKYPEVLECHLITGQDADYFLKVVVEDMDGYQQFLLNKITPIKGVSGVHSSFVLKSPLNTGALPV
ncbi:MAG: Lrp/AsnC family transcriptional regulator [Porticoccaceae bacterium]|nr:Lrp/AsnC family transcriptional regulator [Pseudomonadales bacterium]